jgi:hypothetical protein
MPYPKKISTCTICHDDFKCDKYSQGLVCTKRECRGEYSSARQKEKSKPLIDAYELSPTLCNQCSTPLSYRRRKEKFCCQSCAAKYNNSHRSPDVYKEQKETWANKPKSSIPKTRKYKSKPKNKSIKLKISKPPKIDIQSQLPDDLKLYPSVYPGVIKFASFLLGKDKSFITNCDVTVCKEWIRKKLHVDNMSPNDLAESIGSKHRNFSSFVKSTLGIPLKTISDSLINYSINNGRGRTDDREVYWAECRFKFDVFMYPQIPGYELLSQFEFYNSVTNKNGLNRDHMISISYGYDNKIDPSIISHPANCHIMFARDNFSKNTGCSITLPELLDRIESWKNSESLQLAEIKKVSMVGKSKTHRENLSKANIGLRNYTNGKNNIRQHKDLPVPPGYKSGMTRGLNPRSDR